MFPIIWTRCREVNAGQQGTDEANGETTTIHWSLSWAVSCTTTITVTTFRHLSRADGSSRFPKGNKYALFPSVSASWRVISEAFIRDQDIFSDLKLRGGWGRVGNQNINNNATLTLLAKPNTIMAIRLANGYFVSTVGNNQLKWETVEDWNVGVDMSFLDSRLGVTFEYFQKKVH